MVFDRSTTIKDVTLEVFVEDANWDKALQDHTLLAETAIRAACTQKICAKTSLECNLILANDSYVQKLNREFRGKDKPTNVLSFPTPQNSLTLDETSIGDIFLALETIQKEALSEEKQFAHHFQHLVIHGFLHLLGYDHENESDAKIMEDLEIKTLATLGIHNPYLESDNSRGTSING
jgi:probable rRNA maturation factor